MAFTVKKQANLKFKKNTTFKIPRTGIIQPFLPSSLGGLSLWLKADAGVNKFSYSYVSKIILNGGDGDGTYNASSIPNWSFNNSRVFSYSLGDIYYDSDNNYYTLGLSDGAIISSSDGINWNVDRTVYSGGPTIAGVTGDYAGGNGSYDKINDPWDYQFRRVDGNWTFYIQGSSPSSFAFSAFNNDTDEYFENIAICTNGTWVSYASQTTNISGGTTGISTSPSVPTGTITTSNVDTDYVLEWADQSGNGTVLTPDIQYPPTFVSSFLNGKPAIEFIANDNTGLSNPSFGLTGFTFFSVAKQKPTNGGRIFSSYYGNVLIGTWGNLSNRFYGGNENGWLYEGTQESTDFLITTAFSDADTSFDFSQNGVSQSSGNSDSTVILNGISIGGGIWNGGNIEASDSYVCEIVIYNRTLTSTERQQVEAYLNEKYAIY